jgi:UDP-glucose 4-epimerase
LVAALLAAGDAVRTVSREPAPNWLRALAPESIAVDLSREDPAPALAGADVVLHLAGANEVAAAADPDGTLGGTVAAARRVAAAAAATATRFVYVSTIHVYGASIVDGATLTEDTLPAPRHPYALARLASEHAVASVLDPDQLVVFRLSNAVGAPIAATVDRWSLLVNDLCRGAAVNDELVLKSAGLQWRDFIPLTDAVAAMVAARDRNTVPGGTYNLASGASRTVRDVAGLVQDAFERRTGRRPTLTAPEPNGPVPAPYRVDIGRLAALGLAPRQHLESAIDETASFCLENLESLKT